MRIFLSMLMLAAISLAPFSASAYTIGGMYVTLVKCEYGQYGYKYGHIGTYKGANGQIFTKFFGNRYCPA